MNLFKGLRSRMNGLFHRPTKKEKLQAINVEIEEAKRNVKISRSQGDKVAVAKYREDLAQAITRFNDLNLS